MRVLLLCNQFLSDFDVRVIDSIRGTPQVQVVGALVNIKPGRSLYAKLRSELRKGRGGFVVILALKKLKDIFKKNRTVHSDTVLKGLPIKKATSLYSDDIMKWLREQNADCLFLRGFGIIREPVLSLCKYGVISYHHGDMLKYRGGPPAFWELYNDEAEVGVTIQRLDQGLDTGTILLQRFFPILSTDNWFSLRRRIYDGSIDMAVEALQKLSKTGAEVNPVGEKGKLYTLPNFRQWLSLQLKLIKRKITK